MNFAIFGFVFDIWSKSKDFLANCKKCSFSQSLQSTFVYSFGHKILFTNIIGIPCSVQLNLTAVTPLYATCKSTLKARRYLVIKAVSIKARRNPIVPTVRLVSNARYTFLGSFPMQNFWSFVAFLVAVGRISSYVLECFSLKLQGV